MVTWKGKPGQDSWNVGSRNLEQLQGASLLAVG